MKRFNKAQMSIVNTCACNTHTIWLEEFAVKVTKAFGFLCKTWEFKNQPTEPKGAHLRDKDGNPIPKMMGVDSESVLDQIARFKGFKYVNAENYNGRGFRVSAKAKELVDAFGPKAKTS